MSTDATCERPRSSIVAPMPKKASEAIIGTVCVSKIPCRKEVTFLRSVLSRKEVLDAKRARLRRLFRREAIELEKSLRALGYDFIPTQP